MVKLLSPANSLGTVKIAFDSGADAVYVGVNGWGLRPSRFELSEDDLKRSLDYAKKKQKELYVCMNILPTSDELPAFLEEMQRFHYYGIDAVIVSDIGVIDWIVKNIPGLNIHASVHCNVVNHEAALFYQELGSSMIILSRSLVDLNEVKRIREAVNIDIGVFVHGDVCTNFDGLCYLSGYMKREKPEKPCRRKETDWMGGSNRGECYLVCKQPCELIKNGILVDQGKLLYRENLISLDILPDLINCGINFFKIEGRQFSKEYISTVTSIYRRAIDACLNEHNDYHVKTKWKEKLSCLIKNRDTSYETQKKTLGVRL